MPFFSPRSAVSAYRNSSSFPSNSAPVFIRPLPAQLGLLPRSFFSLRAATDRTDSVLTPFRPPSPSVAREDIMRNTFCLASRNRPGILYEMYNLAGCSVVSRNLRSAEPTASQPSRKSLYSRERRWRDARASFSPTPRPTRAHDLAGLACATHAADAWRLYTCLLGDDGASRWKFERDISFSSRPLISRDLERFAKLLRQRGADGWDPGAAPNCSRDIFQHGKIPPMVGDFLFSLDHGD